jgi:hypothetical protein
MRTLTLLQKIREIDPLWPYGHVWSTKRDIKQFSELRAIFIFICESYGHFYLIPSKHLSHFQAFRKCISLEIAILDVCTDSTMWTVAGNLRSSVIDNIDKQSFSDPAISSDSDSDWSPKFGLGLGLGLCIVSGDTTFRNRDFPTPWPKIISQWNTNGVLTIVDICACGL